MPSMSTMMSHPVYHMNLCKFLSKKTTNNEWKPVTSMIYFSNLSCAHCYEIDWLLSQLQMILMKSHQLTCKVLININWTLYNVFMLRFKRHVMLICRCRLMPPAADDVRSFIDDIISRSVTSLENETLQSRLPLEGAQSPAISSQSSPRSDKRYHKIISRVVLSWHSFHLWNYWWETCWIEWEIG